MSPKALILVSVTMVLLSVLTSGQTTVPNASSSPAVASQTGPAFDVNAAVEAYLAKMPPERRAQSNSYFEGGYWLILWDFLYSAIVMLLLLRMRWSAKMRDLAERLTRFRPLQTAIYWIQFIVVVSVLTFPLSLYEGYFREHKYGLLNQTFGPWMRDQLVGLGVAVYWGRS